MFQSFTHDYTALHYTYTVHRVILFAMSMLVHNLFVL